MEGENLAVVVRLFGVVITQPHYFLYTIIITTTCVVVRGRRGSGSRSSTSGIYTATLLPPYHRIMFTIIPTATPSVNIALSYIIAYHSAGCNIGVHHHSSCMLHHSLLELAVAVLAPQYPPAFMAPSGTGIHRPQRFLDRA